MFGHHKRKREKKRAKKREAALQEEINKLKQDNDKTAPTPVEELKAQQEQINQVSESQRERDEAAADRGKTHGEEVINRKYEGLDRVERGVLSEGANAQINKDIHGYQKKLLGQQGGRGVTGGAAYAQQRDLVGIGADAQQQMQRDLTTLDRDLAMKKAAAVYNVEQGEVAQEALRQQMANDQLQGLENKKYQKWLAEQANKLFHGV